MPPRGHLFVGGPYDGKRWGATIPFVRMPLYPGGDTTADPVIVVYERIKLPSGEIRYVEEGRLDMIKKQGGFEDWMEFLDPDDEDEDE